MILSELSLRFYLKSLKSVWFIVIFAFVIQLFTRGGNTIFQIGFIRISDVGLFNAFIITFRIIFAVLLASVLTLTTSPTSLAHALEDVLRWFFVPKRFAHEIAMVMTIAIRFIPVIASEADRIMKAQLSRVQILMTENFQEESKEQFQL